MDVRIGIKSDPIESRYSFEWLFDLMKDLGVHYVQLGSFPEVFSLEDGWFLRVRERAAKRGVAISSCFTTHRDLGGFFLDDPYRERATRAMYERYIQVASLLGADSAGGNPGCVHRDRMRAKEPGITRYLRHMKELMALAKEKGLQFLALEPMSCLAEPPTLPEELERMMGELLGHHRRDPQGTVPVYCCSDIGHGYADAEGRVIHGNWELFERQIPHMGEFHFKNTDAIFNATWGFSAEERRRGIVDLSKLKALIDRNTALFPRQSIIGYFETGGPKVGRDYSDRHLRSVIVESITAIQEVFAGGRSALS